MTKTNGPVLHFYRSFPSFSMMSKMHQYNDWALLALRVAVGAVFIYHGNMKWGFAWGTPGISVMKILSIAEPLGGAAMIAGVLTNWAALGLMIIMAGALYS